MNFENQAVEVIFKNIAEQAIRHSRSTGMFPVKALDFVLTTHFIRPDLRDALYEYVHYEAEARDANDSWEAHHRN